MKSFKEHKYNQNYKFQILTESEFIDLSNEDRIKLDESLLKVDEAFKDGVLDEGLLSTIIGGVGGLLIGPFIGKVIAKALGVDKGLLYNLLTSKVVNTALGAAISDYIINGKKQEPNG